PGSAILQRPGLARRRTRRRGGRPLPERTGRHCSGRGLCSGAGQGRGRSRLSRRGGRLNCGRGGGGRG
ncbi:MAG: hypothetical protein ACK559_38020, partial [bacterium]